MAGSSILVGAVRVMFGGGRTKWCWVGEMRIALRKIKMI